MMRAQNESRQPVTATACGQGGGHGSLQGPRCNSLKTVHLRLKASACTGFRGSIQMSPSVRNSQEVAD